MTEQLLCKSLSMLATLYPDAKVSADMLTLYQELLADIPDAILEQAVHEYAKNNKWFPKVSELREIARRLANLADCVGFESAPMIDGLTAKAQELEDKFYDGEFDPWEWEKLADDFNKADRPLRADRTRQREGIYAAYLNIE